MTRTSSGATKLQTSKRAAIEFAGDVSKRASLVAARDFAQRGRHRAAVRALSAWEHDLDSADTAVLDAERRAVSLEAPVLARAGRPDRDWFIALSDHINSIDSSLKSSSDR